MAVTLGELLGFGVPALIGAGAYLLRLPEAALAAAVVAGGVAEGAVLGLFQWRVLHQWLPSLPGRAWVLATTGGATLAWVIGMGLTSLGPLLWERSPLLLAAVATVSATLFLLTMGGAQWVVLRRQLPHAWWWIVANALAWPLGVAVPVVGLSLVPDGAAVVAIAGVGLVSGALMGVVVGAVTGAALVWLLDAGRSRRPAPGEVP